MTFLKNILHSHKAPKKSELLIISSKGVGVKPKMEEDYVRWPIIWIKGLFKIGRTHVIAGICTKTRKVCKIATEKNFLRIILVNDFYIEKGQCEEGYRCLNLECEYNRTTVESFAHSLGYKKRITDEEKQRFKERCETIQNEVTLKIVEEILRDLEEKND